MNKPLKGITVYIAGSSKELKRAEQAKKRVQSLGGKVTSSWMASVAKYGANPKSASKKQCEAWADKCRTELARATYVLFLVPKEISAGMMYEKGWSDSLWGNQVYDDSLGGSKHSIFLMAEVMQPDLDSAITELLVMAAGGSSRDL